jgi:hypothetical protein
MATGFGNYRPLPRNFGMKSKVLSHEGVAS